MQNTIKKSELQELCSRVKKQLSELSKFKDDFRYENRIKQWNEYILNYDKIEELQDWLKKCSRRGSYHHFSDVEKMLDKIYGINMFRVCEKLKQRSNFGKIIVLGGQGTGKTHGITNEVEMQLQNSYNIPILVQAKSISPQDEWKDIIIRVLGLSQKWSEDELWSALEAMSYRNEVNYAMNELKGDNVRIVPKIIICVDGIDEIQPYSRWNERINQVNAVFSRHQRIRFCFIGRPYAFERKSLETEQDCKKIVLSDEGDISVKEIYDQYIQYYSVDDKGVEWLRYSISTPYSLKLLCELYKGKRIEKIGKSDVTVAKLLQMKFDKLNDEFKVLAGFEENINDQIVKIVLLKINEIFENNTEVTKVQIKSVLRNLDIYCYLNERGLEKILDFLEKHCFLQSYQKCTKSFFEENETIYMLGVQPVYDYLKALRLFEKSKYSDELELDIQVLDNTGALQMYSIMVMDCYEKTLWWNKSCQEYLDEEDLFCVVAFTLVNVNVDISSKYKEWVFAIMSGNAFSLSLVVNKIVLPLARVEKHPLGSIILDKYLKKFEKPADRDVIWSIPSGLRGNDELIWVRYEDVEYSNETYKLEDMDSFDGMPLIWAWGLTSVDNEQRTMIRKEITRWAIVRPEEFYKLFRHFANSNDLQLQTDIFAIAMAVTYVCRKNHKYLKLISKWIYHNIFAYGKIIKIYNAAIRYYSRAIMECAFSEKVITDIQIDKCRPPYRISNSLLPFAPEATKGTRMVGYKMMDYDLARYVLCDSLDRMFLTNKTYKNEIQKIVEKYSKKYNLPELTSEKFVLGSAFGYIKETGWNEKIFYGVPNGGKPGEKLGLDIEISRRYGQATHGRKSSIMTITEKYTWCAKMNLLGYLADRLPYQDYEENSHYVNDYGKLGDYVNPYQELCQAEVKKLIEDGEWILPEELAPTIKEFSYSKEGINKWLIESPIPNFKKWINIKEDEVALFAAHCINNEEQGVETMMWLSSGLIEKGAISALTKSLNNKDLAWKLIDAAELVAYPLTDCNVSPLEVCWQTWKEENESKISYGSNVLYKNVTRCACEFQEEGEVYYQMPSKKIRNIMRIVSGDGYHYYNNDGREVAHCTQIGEYYGDGQRMLLVNKEAFYSGILEEGLQPVWFVRVLKQVSSKAREKYDFFADKDETYLVWKNSRYWQTRRIEWEE